MNLKENFFTRAKKSIFFKISVIFLAALFLSVSCLLLFSHYYYQSSSKELSARIRSQAYLSLELSVNNKLDEYANILYSLTTDAEIREQLLLSDSDDKQVSSLAVRKLSGLMQEFAYGNKDIIAITAVAQKGRTAVYDRSRLKLGSTLWVEDKLSGQMDAMLKHAQDIKKIEFIADDRHPEGMSFIHVVLSVWDYYTKEDMGVIVVTVNAKSLWQLIGSAAAEESAFDFLMQPDGQLLVHPDLSMVGMPIAGYSLDDKKEKLIENGTDLGDSWVISDNASIQFKKLEKYDIYLVSVLNSAVYSDLVAYYFGIASAFVILIGLVSILIFIIIINGQMKSIRAVIAGIKKMQDGNLDVRIEIPQRDEIYDIAQTFNKSMQNLQAITNERDEEMRQYLLESERRRKAEARSLLSQINSHFLYNTLNAINYTAMEGDGRKTSRMIKSLADCLRYTLNHNWDVVRVADEVEWLKKYLLLQKERQPSLFDYSIQVPDDVLDMPIHKLIIQPFVENAIIHGFEGSKTPRNLMIRFKKLSNPDRLTIAIYDDGCGIEAEKMSEISQLLKNYTKADGLGIGIENACFRISNHYKDNARIFVRSQPGHGTKFNIVLPL